MGIITKAMELWATFGYVIPDWLAAITALVVAANGITMLTPTKADDKVVNSILRVLNWLSLNVFKNKNADDL